MKPFLLQPPPNPGLDRHILDPFISLTRFDWHRQRGGRRQGTGQLGSRRRSSFLAEPPDMDSFHSIHRAASPSRVLAVTPESEAPRVPSSIHLAHPWSLCVLRDTDVVRSSPGPKELIRRKTDQHTRRTQRAAGGRATGAPRAPKGRELFCWAVGRAGQGTFPRESDIPTGP